MALEKSGIKIPRLVSFVRKNQKKKTVEREKGEQKKRREEEEEEKIKRYGTLIFGMETELK